MCSYAELKIDHFRKGIIMDILLTAILFLAGILLMRKPECLYRLERWKHEEESEPSELFLASTRFGGGVLVVISIVFVIALCCEYF